MLTSPANEAPQYEALRRAVQVSFGVSRSALRQMRGKWFRAIRLRDPGALPRKPVKGANASTPVFLPPLRADDDDETSRTPRVAAPLSDAQRRAIDEALEEYLTLFAGGDRSEAGYVNEEDAVLQRHGYLSHRVGVERAQRQLGRLAFNPELAASQRRRVMEQSFARLSENGKLRFEVRLNDIRDSLVRMFNQGDNPLKIARELAADLDGYEAGRLRTLIRTEAAFASEGAISGTYAAAGVERYAVIGDPTTDGLCVSAQTNGPYLLTDDSRRPPLHPNCFCSQIPVVE